MSSSLVDVDQNQTNLLLHNQEEAQGTIMKAIRSSSANQSEEKPLMRRMSQRAILKPSNYFYTNDVLTQSSYNDFLFIFVSARRGVKYAQINKEEREQFVNEVIRTKCTIKSAAKKYNINFSTAKAIMQTYRNEGRIGKKEKRVIKKRRGALLKKLRMLAKLKAQNQKEQEEQNKIKKNENSEDEVQKIKKEEGVKEEEPSSLKENPKENSILLVKEENIPVKEETCDQSRSQLIIQQSKLISTQPENNHIVRDFSIETQRNNLNFQQFYQQQEYLLKSQQIPGLKSNLINQQIIIQNGMIPEYTNPLMMNSNNICIIPPDQIHQFPYEQLTRFYDPRNQCWWIRQ